MEYEVYHDESQVAGYWHGILLVPVPKKNVLLQYLNEIRSNTNYNGVIGIKKIKQERSRAFRCARAWTEIGVGSLVQDFKNEKYPIHIEKGKNNCYGFMKDLVAAKFILFRERDNHNKMLYYPDYGAKVETTYRMALKGGLNFLSFENNPIHVIKLHFDGYEHYGRNLDKTRIVDRIKGLKDYCSFADDDDLIDDRTSRHTKADSQSYDDCQLLQLTDLLVGSFRTILGESTKSIHKELAFPVKSIIIRYNEGYARMRNSKWFKGFCMSQCYLDKNGWRFSSLEPITENNLEQQKLIM